jgi:transcriptional regulator with XRE-family HTH domain
LRLAALRNGLDVPQEKYAKDLGVAQSTLAQIETGDINPSLDFIEAVAEKFYANPAWILGFGDEIFTHEVLNHLLTDKVIKALKNPPNKRRGSKTKSAVSSRHSRKT